MKKQNGNNHKSGRRLLKPTRMVVRLRSQRNLDRARKRMPERARRRMPERARKRMPERERTIWPHWRMQNGWR